jgi:hypothetical protein
MIIIKSTIRGIRLRGVPTIFLLKYLIHSFSIKLRFDSRNTLLQIQRLLLTCASRSDVGNHDEAFTYRTVNHAVSAASRSLETVSLRLRLSSRKKKKKIKIWGRFGDGVITIRVLWISERSIVCFKSPPPLWSDECFRPFRKSYRFASSRIQDLTYISDSPKLSNDTQQPLQ